MVIKTATTTGNTEDYPGQDSNTSHADQYADSTDLIIGIWQKLKRFISYVMDDLGGYQLFDSCVQWCIRNPQLAICLCTGIIVMLLPFLIFLAFGITTFILTLTGLLVLEGTLLTFMSMMLFGLLGALLLVVLFFVVIGLSIGFGFNRIQQMCNPSSHTY